MNHKQMHRKRGMKNKFIFVAMIVLIVLAGVYAYYYDFEDLVGEATASEIQKLQEIIDNQNKDDNDRKKLINNFISNVVNDYVSDDRAAIVATERLLELPTLLSVDTVNLKNIINKKVELQKSSGSLGTTRTVTGDNTGNMKINDVKVGNSINGLDVKKVTVDSTSKRVTITFIDDTTHTDDIDKSLRDVTIDRGGLDFRIIFISSTSLSSSAGTGTATPSGSSGATPSGSVTTTTPTLATTKFGELQKGWVLNDEEIISVTKDSGKTTIELKGGQKITYSDNILLKDVKGPGAFGVAPSLVTSISTSKSSPPSGSVSTKVLPDTWKRESSGNTIKFYDSTYTKEGDVYKLKSNPADTLTKKDIQRVDVLDPATNERTIIETWTEGSVAKKSVNVYTYQPDGKSPEKIIDDADKTALVAKYVSSTPVSTGGTTTPSGSSGATPSGTASTPTNVDLSTTKIGDVTVGWKLNGKEVTKVDKDVSTGKIVIEAGSERFVYTEDTLLSEANVFLGGKRFTSAEKPESGTLAGTSGSSSSTPAPSATAAPTSGTAPTTSVSALQTAVTDAEDEIKRINNEITKALAEKRLKDWEILKHKDLVEAEKALDDAKLNLKYTPIENIDDIRTTDRDAFTYHGRKYDFEGGWYTSSGFDVLLGQVGFFLDPDTGEEIIINSLGTVTVFDYDDNEAKTVEELESNLLKNNLDNIKSLFIQLPEKPKTRDFFSYETFDTALSFAKEFQSLSGFSSLLFSKDYLADYRKKANAFWDNSLLKATTSSGLTDVICDDLINIPNKNNADILFTTTPTGTVSPSVSINGVRLGSPDGKFLYRIQAVVNIPPSLISVVDNSGLNPNDVKQGTTAILVGVDSNNNRIPLITEDGTQTPTKIIVQNGLSYAGEKAIVIPYTKVKLVQVCIEFSDSINFYGRKESKLCNELSSEFESTTIAQIAGTSPEQINEELSGSNLNPVFS